MAQIIDITQCDAIKEESYFIDTNVWFWFTYFASKNMTLPSQPQSYQINDYPRFIERALDDGAKLFHCAMTFTELANIIENTEWAIYKKKNDNEFILKKDFRKDQTARNVVLNEINLAWSTVSKFSSCKDINLTSEFVSKSQQIMNNSSVDPFDAFYAQIMKENKIDYIVTDDFDFCSVDQLMVLTSNKQAIK